jgi:hypothetical protein
LSDERSGDRSQEGVAVVRRNRASGLQHSIKLGVGELYEPHVPRDLPVLN